MKNNNKKACPSFGKSEHVTAVEGVVKFPKQEIDFQYQRFEKICLKNDWDNRLSEVIILRQHFNVNLKFTEIYS